MHRNHYKYWPLCSFEHLASGRPRSESGGYTLFFVLIASSIAATMAVALSIRAYTGYTDTKKQSLSIKARDAAESGLAILVESLNRDYPEWLISSFDKEDEDRWTARSLVGSGCDPDIEGSPTVTGITKTFSNGTTSNYELESYRFDGNEFYGGKGQFVMNGIVRSKGGKVLAESQVTQEMQVMTKTCGALPGDNTGNERIWPGMFMTTISRYGYTEVIQKGTSPPESGTVLCASETCAGKNANASYWKTDFPPWPPTVGDVKSPDALSPPKELKGVDIKTFAKKVNSVLKKQCKDFIVPDDLDDISKSSWLKDDEGTIHVYLKGYTPGSIDGGTCRGKPKPSIKIAEGPVRLYVDSKNLKIGKRTWIDTTSLNHAADFMILGTQKQDAQTLQIGGNSPNGETLKTFIWMPTGKIHLLLNDSKDIRHIEGAIWGKDYMCTCDNAINNPTRITVPEDMPSMIFQRLGKEFGIGRRDFFAQGVTNWRSFSRLKK